MALVKNPGRTLVFRNPGHSIAFLLFFLLLVVTYSNSLNASWHLDDEPNITANRRLHIKHFSWSQVKEALLSAPSTSKVSFLRPVSRLSFALNHYFGGLEVFGYHVVNLSIHILAAWFLYLFVFKTLRLPRFREEYGSRAFTIALLSSLFWAVHPIQTQAVTYVVQRMTSLAGLFYIMSMYFYVRSRTLPDRSARTIWLVLCAICGLLALGSKENAVLIPAGIYLFHHLVLEKPEPTVRKRNLKLFLLLYILPLLAGLAYLEMAHDAISKLFEIYENRTFTLVDRLLTEPRVLVLYITLLFYPMAHRFSVDHDLIVSSSLFSPKSTFPAVLLIILILFAACLQARRRPLLSFSVLFFFLNHLLESTILPMELVFEHRNYIPSMFLFLPVAMGIVKGLSIFSRSRITHTIITISTCFILLAFAYSAFVRNSVWKDERSLWEDVLWKYPDSFRAHTNLGRHFVLQGQDEKAANEFFQALAGRQTHTRVEKSIALFNLGYLAHKGGDRQRAFQFYSKALEIDPCCPRANNNLAVLLLETDNADHSEALRLLNKALECKNESEIDSALANKRDLLMKMGDTDDIPRTTDAAP